MPANILNLTAYAVTALSQDEHDYHISTEVSEPPKVCPKCRSDRIVGFGRREQLVKDLPIHGKRVGIYINTRRMRCRACAKTFSEALPEVDERRLMTRRLVDWIGKQAIKRTFASIADEVGVVEGTVRIIFKDYVAELEKAVQFETPKWMGIDEIHLIRPRCVITNIANNTIVDLLRNRNKETVARYLSTLKARDCIQYVAMDMWNPYREAVQTVLPHAHIVIDKFHVVRMANDALERVRKSLRESLTPKQRRGLMHDRFVLLKRERNLTDKERLNLDGWIKNYPELGLAYRLKEDFYGIYDANSLDEARRRYEAWNHSITPDVRHAFADLIRAWTNWMPFILEYFNHPITNAYTESLNNLIRVTNRLGRGYSFEVLRAKILFTEGIHKLSRPKFERKDRSQRDAIKEMLEWDGAAVIDKSFSRWLLSDFEIASPPLKFTEPRTGEAVVKHYGVDISTLARMIENGEI